MDINMPEMDCFESSKASGVQVSFNFEMKSLKIKIDDDVIGSDHIKC